MEDILECPQCRSREISLIPDQTAKFIYKCNNCNYSGPRIIKLDKLEEQKKKLMSMTLSKGTRKEIEEALRKKKAGIK
ncbi:hypothetical protein HYX18_01775 [Candidatus Woesearchaeota archaeon]|nr:hypothetical protein [Candidatus Woesearchaeota archaeon]